MGYTKIALCVIAASIVSLAVAATLIQYSNFGNTHPTELPLQQLASDGPGSNAFVRLSNYSIAGDPVRVQRGKLNNFYIPLFADVADSEAKTPIRVVLKIDSANSDQLPTIFAELKNPKKRIEGLWLRQLGATDDYRFIQEQHQRSAFGAHVIHYGSTPQLWQLFLGLGIVAIVYVFYFLGTLQLCKSTGKPRTRLDRLGMIVTGTVACLIGGYLYYQHSTVPIFATIGLTFVGLGFARLLVGKLALKIEDHLFTGNWFLTNDVCVSDNVFLLRSGRKKFELPIDDIEAVGLTWYDDNNSSVDRTQYSLRMVTREGKVRINGLILQNERGKYGREFSQLYAHLESRFWNQLTDGNECSGEGWRLSASKLSLTRNKLEDLEIPVESLSGVEKIERELRFWVRGNEQHVAAIPVAQLNVELLFRCLKRLLQIHQSDSLRYERPATGLNQPLFATDVDDQPQTGLGIIKFTETSKRSAAVWFAGLLPLGVILCCCGQWLIGISCAFASLPALKELLKKRKTLRVHENGISIQRGDELEMLAFENMDSVTCETTRHMNGTNWEGDSYELRFEGGIDGQRTVLKFLSPASVSNAYLDLIQKASVPVAQRMAEQLCVADKVEWVPGCYLWKDGLEAPFGSLLKGKVQKIDFHLLSKFKIENDRLRIYVDGKKTAAFVIDMSQENFTGGYLLLKVLAETSIDENALDEEASDQRFIESV